MIETGLKIAEFLFAGDMRGIIFLLVLIILGLGWDRHRLIKAAEKKEEKLDEILKDYHKGNLTLAEALNNIRMVLYEIKGKI